MFGDGSLTFREFATREPLPLATIHDAVLEFLGGRADAVLFGAQAVNAYVDEPRMTQSVDILTPDPAAFAEELRTFLADRFQVAIRVRTLTAGRAYRVFQLSKPRNRHLADIRGVAELPPHRLIERVRVATPEELVAQKVISLTFRRQTAKGMTDLADIRRLLLAFPALQTESEVVGKRLAALGADPAALASWKQIAAEEILPDEDGGY